MTYYLLIALCVIILIAYIFEITSKYTKVPGVILLIITGLAANYLLEYFNIAVPNLSGLLPLMGTLGLILIVLEGSLDLTLRKEKKWLIVGSINSALWLFIIFEAIFAFVLVKFYDIPLDVAILNTIPIGIISSAVAIPSAMALKSDDREFIVYESSFSDIVGILAFDFILINSGSIGRGLLGFGLEFILTIVISVVVTAGLAYILHKITHHVKYVIITTVVVLVYALAKLIHMPSLLVVLIFGLILNNNHLFKNKFSDKLVDFKSFNSDLNSFKHITGELTFVVRSFFFIIFGYYTSILDILNLDNLMLASIVSASIFILRALFFRFILRIPMNPLMFFAPRGLITILLFLSIPYNKLLPFMTQGLVTQIIFLTILMMTFGNVFLKIKVKP
jgi:Kef-type K+ transport system membrane component KefB